MSPGPRLITVLVAALMLSGCGYRPMKAPCSADEGGVPVAYSALKPTRSSEPLALQDGCGPMRKI